MTALSDGRPAERAASFLTASSFGRFCHHSGASVRGWIIGCGTSTGVCASKTTPGRPALAGLSIGSPSQSAPDSASARSTPRSAS